MSVNRRNFLLGTAAAAVAVAAGQSSNPKKQPNVVIYHSDQFRWDFVGANGLNNSVRTRSREVTENQVAADKGTDGRADGIKPLREV